ncbi:MAG: hypothetical protein GY856_10035 [bacterium]|nr:hypothetical protein [bacterium]
MSYPGNPSLPQEIQDRISGTFEQTLELAAEGKDQEALVGCDFVLRLDPDYQPAKTLNERLQSDQRPVVLDDLRAAGTAQPEAGDAPAEVDPGLIEAPSAPVAKPTGGLAAVLHDLLVKGNYQQVLQIAETQKETIEKDPQLQELVSTARSQLEPQKITAPEDSDLLELQRQSLAFDDGLADPFADEEIPGIEALDEIPAIEALEEIPAAEAVDEIPAVDVFDEIPGPDVFDEIPGADAFDEIPGADAFDEIPGVDAFDEIPAVEALEEVPAGQAPAAEPLDELETLSFDEMASPAEEPVIEPPAEDEGAQLDMLSLEGEGEAVEAVEEPEEEGGDRIAQLLSEGQEVFDRGEFQGAIDVWSRIFLIDIDNDEASRRIEEARNKKAELERQAEEIFHEGIGHIEKEALDEAKESFRRVLEVAPGHTLAREYLEQLEAGEVPSVVGVAELDAAALADELAGADDGAPAGVQSMEAAVQRDRVVVVKKTDKRLIAMGAAVLVLVFASVGFLVLKWDDLFPNTEAVAPGLRQQIDPITRATQMHENGNTENAIAVLEKIPLPDPTYADAQALIAQWKALVEAPEEVVDTGPSPELIERRNLLLTAARDAHAQRHYIRSRKYFEQAGKIAPLTTGDLTLRRDCDTNLEHLTAEMRGFEDGEYATILPRLWRQRETRPHDNDIVLLIVNSYYNLALTDLQRGDPMGAAEKMQEAIEVEPDNDELERLRLFAMTYTDKPPDLLYRIYVKYLPSR